MLILIHIKCPLIHGLFSDPYFKVLWEWVTFIGASATKSFERSRIFRYVLPKDILSKGQKTKAGV